MIVDGTLRAGTFVSIAGALAAGAPAAGTIDGLATSGCQLPQLVMSRLMTLPVL